VTLFVIIEPPDDLPETAAAIGQWMDASLVVFERFDEGFGNAIRLRALTGVKDGTRPRAGARRSSVSLTVKGLPLVQLGQWFSTAHRLRDQLRAVHNDEGRRIATGTVTEIWLMGLTIYRHGLRVSDACDLRRDDIDLPRESGFSSVGSISYCEQTLTTTARSLRPTVTV
jgi:hypothetical protein